MKMKNSNKNNEPAAIATIYSTAIYILYFHNYIMSSLFSLIVSNPIYINKTN